MKLNLFILLFLSTAAHSQQGWKRMKHSSDTSLLSQVTVFHCEGCTGALDLDIDKGHLRLPAPYEGLSLGTMNISPEQQKILYGKKNQRSGYMFELRGRVTHVKDLGRLPKAGPQLIPFFEIHEYRVVRKMVVFSPSLVNWINVDSLFQPLPPSVHVYFGNQQDIQDEPGGFRAYYVTADLKDKNLQFTVDTTLNRRLTPSAFYEKNQRPLLVMNTTFFSFASNRNLNLVMKNGKLLGYNTHSIAGRGKDTFTYRHPLGSAIGITKKRVADIAWTYTDSSLRHVYASQFPVHWQKDSLPSFSLQQARLAQAATEKGEGEGIHWKEWKVQTAVGGGPVLIQEGEIRISNNEELKFAGKAIDDKHPRTAMGYTPDGRLILLVIEGRNKEAAGASLQLTAEIMRDLGCVEALNLDGGGSSCMLVNGKETIRVSDASGQRPVPCVFIIRAN